MAKIAHVTSVYRDLTSILEPKLVGLDAFPGIDVTAITPERVPGIDLPVPRVRVLTVPMVRPIRPLSDVRSVWRLYRALRAEEFDIVHSHSAKAGFVTAVAARMARVPLSLHTYHGLPFFEGQSRWAFHMYRLLEWFACKFRDHVFSQNRRDMDACVKLMGSADKVSYEGNGVDPAGVCAEAEPGRKNAAGLYPPGSLRLALVSRLEPVKRVHDFVEACAILEAEGADFAAVVAGFGDLESEIRDQVERAGLGHRVKLLGWVREAKSLLAEADIAVLVSEKEGVPRALMEAMALEKPVVATDVLGTQELVVNNETGFLVPLGRPEAVAAAITELGNKPALREQFGIAGRLRVQEDYNDPKIVDYLANFYNEHTPTGT